VEHSQSSPPEAAHRLRLQNAYTFAVCQGSEPIALAVLGATRGNRNQGLLDLLPLRDGVELAQVYAVARESFAAQFGMSSFLVAVPERHADLERTWLALGFVRVATIPWGDFWAGRRGPVAILFRSEASR
jgi:hypothetical protein